MANRPSDLELGDTEILAMDYTEENAARPFHVLAASGAFVSQVPNPPLRAGNLMSPLRTSLAYLSGDGLVVIGADMEVRSIVHLDFNEHVEYLDEERIVSYMAESSPVRTRVWDVATGLSTAIEVALPALWSPQDWVYARWGVIYSPDLARLAYTLGDPVPERVVLWDVSESRPIWELARWSSSTIRPSWNSPGTTLAVAAADEPHHLEVFLIDRDGHSEEWVDVHSDESPDSALVEVVWSPDSRYVALVPVGGNPLFMLDTTTRALVQFCISTDTSDNRLIWSPDGTRVIVPRGGDGAVLLDPADGIAFQLFENPNLKPVAWLNLPK